MTLCCVGRFGACDCNRRDVVEVDWGALEVIVESEEVGLVMESAGAEKVGVESSEVRHFCLGRHRWGWVLKNGVPLRSQHSKTTVSNS